MRIALLLAMLLLSVASPATGQQASDEELYSRGQQHFLQRRFSDALDVFEPLRGKSPNARLYYARCLRELKRLPDAYEEMKMTREEAAKLAKTEQRYAATRDAALKELGELREKVALIQLRPAASYKELEVEINGRVFSNPERLKKPIPVMPGALRVHASASGFDDSTSELEVDARKLTDVAIILTPQPLKLAEVAKKREQQEQQRRLQTRPRSRAPVPPPRMPPGRRGCASIGGDRRQNWLLVTAVFAGLLTVRRRGSVDARRCQPVHRTTHGRPRTRRRDRGVATPPRAALGARQAGGGLGT